MKQILFIAVLVMSFDTSASEAFDKKDIANAAAPRVERRLWLGPDQTQLPFQNDEEVKHFLAKAEVIARKELTGSFNHPFKLRLKLDGVEANAIFRTVDRKKERAVVKNRLFRNYRDSYVFECAAYELSRLLELDHIPPCVLREIDGVQGSLQLWVEDSKTAYQFREDAGMSASQRWPSVYVTMRIFDAMIDNFDRHGSNVLVDSRGKVWFIDHTRSFPLYTKAQGLDQIKNIERCLWERLKALKKGEVREHLDPYVDWKYASALMRRHKQVVKHLQRLIEEKGEQAVIIETS